MIFNSIELNNFGRFKGVQLFQPEITAQRNVVLIKAINDRGKTTLFNAINFAMYGSKALPKDLAEFVSLQAAKDGPGQMWVEIKFEHEGNDFRITRKVDFERSESIEGPRITGNDDVSIFEGGSPLKIVSREEQIKWIDHILPKDASQFFFFDGEEIKKYIGKHSGDNIKSSIEMVLGIKELLNAREDLSKLYNDEFYREYSKKLKLKSKESEDSDEITALESDIDLLKQEIDGLMSNINSADALVKKYDKELQAYSSISEKVKSRESAKADLLQAGEKKKKLQNELIEKRSYAGLLVLTPLLNIIYNTKEDPPTFKVWESEVIKRLLKERPSKCVCDRPLDDDSYNLLKNKIIETKPSKHNALKKLVADVLVREEPKDKRNDFNTIIQEVSEIQQQIDQWDDTLKQLDSEISNASEIGPVIKQINSKRTTADRSIGSYQNDLDKKQELLTKKIAELKSKTKKLANKIGDSEVNKAKDLVDFSMNLRDAIDLAIDRFTNSRISTIAKYSSEVFTKLTNNPDLYVGLELDGSYEIKVKRYDGTTIPTYRYSPSAGQSQIIATSLIAGLSKYTTREAPIVIDTPLGRLDHIHRKNLIKLYPSLNRQVIILYQTSELDANDLDMLRDNLASEWVLQEEPDDPALSRIILERNYL